MKQLLFVSILAFAVWLIAEIPLIRELFRRFRTGPRTLPVLLVLCALAEIAAAIAGFAELLDGNFDYRMTPDIGWDTTVVALVLTFVPVGATFFVIGILVMLFNLFSPFFSFVALFGVPVCTLFLLSPFFRCRLLLRSPSRHPRLIAAFALLTAYLPLISLFACFILACPP